MEYDYNGFSLKSGVYKLTNKLNGRVYIGSAREFKERWREHTKRLKSGNHSNKFLQADYNKCGEDVFVFEVIEVIDGPQENRLLVEQRYIDQHYDDQQQCYNLTRSVNKRGPKCHSYNPENTAAKRKENPNKHRWSEEEKKVISEKLRGHIVSEETRQKLRERNIGKKHTEESKHKCSKSNKGKHKERLMNPEIRQKAIEASILSKKGKPAWNKGKVCTKEEVEKMSLRAKEQYANNPDIKRKLREANLGKKQSEETKRKRIEKLQKPIKAICLDTGLETIYPSIKKACEELGIYDSYIYQFFKGKVKSVKGYIFEMVDTRIVIPNLQQALQFLG